MESSFLNEYYKTIGKLDKINTPEIEDLKHKIYLSKRFTTDLVVI